MSDHHNDNDEPYEALLIGGPFGIAGRIIGSKPRKLSKRERSGIQNLLASGYAIQVLCESETAWRRMRPKLLRQLGFAQGAVQ